MINTYAQIITDTIWGTRGNTLMEKLSSWFWGDNTLRLPRFNATVVTSRLSNLNLTPDQIYMIREQCAEAMLAAREHIVRKYNINENYLGSNGESFGVYQLFWNVGNRALNEHGDLAYKLTLLKLEKLDIGHIPSKGFK